MGTIEEFLLLPSTLPSLQPIEIIGCEKMDKAKNDENRGKKPPKPPIFQTHPAMNPIFFNVLHDSVSAGQ